MKKKFCSWCDNEFEASVSYQIYCSIPCRESATKEKIAEKYALNKRKKNKKRICKACAKPLSIYNDFEICQACLINPVDLKKELKSVKRLMKDEN